MLDDFRSVVAAGSDRPFLIYFDTTLTYGEVDRLSDAFAVALADNGFRRGDRLALYLQNVPQYVLALIATWKLGGIVVAINPMLTPNEVAKLLADSGPTVLVTLDELATPALAEVLNASSVSTVVATSALDFQASCRRDGSCRPTRSARPEGTQDFCSLIADYEERAPAPDHTVATTTSRSSPTPPARPGCRRAR